jgi:hypothetical protein
MDPATLALILGPQVISGGMQFFESQNAREYAQQQQAKLEEALARIGFPSADPSYFTPEVYEYLEKYDPEVAAYVRERDPRMVEMTSPAAMRAQQAEQQVLQDIMGRAREGTDVLAEIQRARGMREAAGTMSSQAATLQQQLQRQGQQGGLAAYGAALQQQQGAGMQAALAGEQAALAGLQERGRALGQAGDLAGRQIGREFDIERANVNAINAFNQRLAQSQQEQANLAAQIRNQGQLENIRGRQRVGEMNVQSQAAARDRRQAFAQQQYQNELAKYGRQAQQVEGNVNLRQQQAQDFNRMIQGLGDVASTGAYMSAKSAPKQTSQQPQQLQQPTQLQTNPYQYDFGPEYYQEDPRKRKTMEA